MDCMGPPFGWVIVLRRFIGAECRRGIIQAAGDVGRTVVT